MARLVILAVLEALLWGCSQSGTTPTSSVTDTSTTTTQTVTSTAATTDPETGEPEEEPTPESFLITYPIEFINTATPIATWAKAPDVLDYDVIVAPDSGCKVPLQAFGDLTTESQQLKVLAEGTYYICVYAIQSKAKLLDAANNPFMFVVDLTPPTAPVLAAMSDNAFINNNTPPISWAAATGHDFYDLLIASDAACLTTVQNYPDIDGTLTSKDVMYGLPDGTYYMCLTARDKAGNTTDASNHGLEFIVDTVRPVATSVTSTTADGTYKAGSLLTFTVTFPEPVNVTTTDGTPTLALETGTVDHEATYASGSGTETLTFTYTILAGDTTSDLDTLAGEAQLVLNGGLIQDRALNDAVLALPTGVTTGSLASQKAIILDTTAPTVLGVTSTTADGAYKPGVTINVSVTFSEPMVVTNGASMSILLETGSTDQSAVYDAAGSTSTVLVFNYVVQAGDLAPDLDTHTNDVIVLAGATLTDVVGNAAILSLPVTPAAATLAGSKAIRADGIGPVISNISSVTANGSYKVGGLINVRVTFDEAVTVVGGGGLQLKLETGASDALVTYGSGTGSTQLIFPYTVDTGHTSADLNVHADGFSVGGATVRDAAGNDAPLTLPAAGSLLAALRAYIIDTTAPTVTAVSASSADGTYKAGDVVTLTVAFSENVDVTNGTNVKLHLETGLTDAEATYSAGTGSNTLSFTYTVAAGEEAPDLDATSLTITPAGIIRDGALNDADLTLPGGATLAGAKNIVIDGVAPGAFAITGPAAATYTASQTATWNASTDATLYDVIVSTTNDCVTPVQAPGSPYLDVAGTSQGLTLADGRYYLCVTAQDAAGNTLAASNQPWSFVVESSVVHVSYTSLNADTYELNYGKWQAGAAASTLVDSNAAATIDEHGSLALDSNEKVHLSYAKESGGLYVWRYATNASGAFAAETAEAGANSDSVGRHSSLALTSGNTVRMVGRYSFDDGIAPEDRLAIVTGNTGAFGGASVIQNESDPTASFGDQAIAIDSTDKTHLLHVYFDGTNDILRYRDDAGGWGTGANEVIAAPGCSQYLHASIALSSNDKVHGATLCVTAGGACRVDHVTNASGAWVYTTVGDVESAACTKAAMTVRHRPTLVLDSNDKAHLVYFDEANDKLIYAENTGGSFVTAEVVWGSGWQPTIARDAADKLYIFYLTTGVGGGNLRLLENNSGTWTNADIDTSGLVRGIGDAAVTGVAGRSNR